MILGDRAFLSLFVAIELLSMEIAINPADVNLVYGAYILRLQLSDSTVLFDEVAW